MASTLTIKKPSTHRRLLQKLSMFGIDNSTLQWIMSLLEDRQMRVTVRGSCSHWVKVISGVPHGSVLGLLLFLICVSDLPGWIKTKMSADDTKLWTTIRHELDSQEMQEDLHRLGEWGKKWLLDFNIEKFKVMHVGHKLATLYSISRAGGTLSSVKCQLSEVVPFLLLEQRCGIVCQVMLRRPRRWRWSRTGWRHTCSAAATKLFDLFYISLFWSLSPPRYSGPCNSFYCLGHSIKCLWWWWWWW